MGWARVEMCPEFITIEDVCYLFCCWVKCGDLTRHSWILLSPFPLFNLKMYQPLLRILVQ